MVHVSSTNELYSIDSQTGDLERKGLSSKLNSIVVTRYMGRKMYRRILHGAWLIAVVVSRVTNRNCSNEIDRSCIDYNDWTIKAQIICVDRKAGNRLIVELKCVHNTSRALWRRDGHIVWPWNLSWRNHKAELAVLIRCCEDERKSSGHERSR